MAAPTQDTAPDARRRSPIGRVVVAGAVILMALFWIWILTGGPRKQNPDYLSDRDWVADAEALCAATRDDVDALPRAEAAGSAAERADVLDDANDLVAAMLVDLGEPLPADDGDIAVVRPWLDDWATYLGDRRAFADALRTDAEAQFLVTEKFNDPIDTVIKTFADVNDMPSCAPFGDLA